MGGLDQKKVRHDFCVYVIHRPNGIPCYVGKGGRGRPAMHAKRTHNLQLERIYKKAGGILKITKTENCFTNEEAVEIEKLLITDIGRADQKLGPLVNHTDGGDGFTGPKAPEHSEKLRQVLIRTAKVRYEKIAIALSRPKTSEEIAKMPQLQKGVPKSQEHIEALRLAQTGLKRSESHIRNSAEGHRGLRRSDETKAKMSAGHKEAWKRRRAEGRDSPKGKRHTPESLAKISEASLRAWALKNPGKTRPVKAEKKRSEESRDKTRSASTHYWVRRCIAEATMKVITIWDAWDANAKKFVFNHISDGFVEKRKTPVAMCDGQERAWEAKKWHRRKAFLNQKNTVVERRGNALA